MLGTAFGKMDLYKKTLDAAWLKQQAISNNMANVNTPGYKRQVVEFESILKDQLELTEGVQMERTHEGHYGPMGLSGVEPRITTIENTSMREDDNNVNIDVEMAEMSKNTIKYNAVSEQLNSQYKRLRIAITGR